MLTVSSGAASATLRFNSYDCVIPVSRVYAHTAFYHYPEENSGGSPYGDVGPQITRNHYVGTAAR
jgi:hypothetical protein